MCREQTLFLEWLHHFTPLERASRLPRWSYETRTIPLGRLAKCKHTALTVPESFRMQKPKNVCKRLKRQALSSAKIMHWTSVESVQ